MSLQRAVQALRSWALRRATYRGLGVIPIAAREDLGLAELVARLAREAGLPVSSVESKGYVVLTVNAGRYSYNFYFARDGKPVGVFIPYGRDFIALPFDYAIRELGRMAGYRSTVGYTSDGRLAVELVNREGRIYRAYFKTGIAGEPVEADKAEVYEPIEGLSPEPPAAQQQAPSAPMAQPQEATP